MHVTLLLLVAVTTSVLGCGLGNAEVIDVRVTIDGPRTLKIGEKAQYYAHIEATPAPGPIDPAAGRGVLVDWSSSNVSVATVTARNIPDPEPARNILGGLVTAIAPGEVVLTATPRHTRKGVTGRMTSGTLTIAIR